MLTSQRLLHRFTKRRDVFLVVIKPQPNPQHIVARIGDDVLRQQCRLPRRRARIDASRAAIDAVSKPSAVSACFIHNSKYETGGTSDSAAMARA